MADTTKTPFAHAPASRLVGAYLIDLLVLGVLLGVTWYVHFTAWTIGMITAEAVVASALMLGASGRTPGMALMRVCMIRDEEDAQTPSLGAALGYTALAVLLQVTVVGLLASYAMVHDGRTWLSGPTRTRFVDLRKHAALAAGPGEVERAERPHMAPSGFESVHEGVDQWSPSRCAVDARALLGAGLFRARSACERPLWDGLQRSCGPGGLPAACGPRHAGGAQCASRAQHACCARTVRCAFGSRCARRARVQRVRGAPRTATGNAGHSPPRAPAPRDTVCARCPRGTSGAQRARLVDACRARAGSRPGQLGSSRSAGAPSARPGLVQRRRAVRGPRIRRARTSAESPRRAGRPALRHLPVGWGRPVPVGCTRDAAAHAAPVAHL